MKKRSLFEKENVEFLEKNEVLYRSEDEKRTKKKEKNENFEFILRKYEFKI